MNESGHVKSKPHFTTAEEEMASWEAEDAAAHKLPECCTWYRQKAFFKQLFEQLDLDPSNIHLKLSSKSIGAIIPLLLAFLFVWGTPYPEGIDPSNEQWKRAAITIAIGFFGYFITPKFISLLAYPLSWVAPSDSGVVNKQKLSIVLHCSAMPFGQMLVVCVFLFLSVNIQIYFSFIVLAIAFALLGIGHLVSVIALIQGISACQQISDTRALLQYLRYWLVITASIMTLGALTLAMLHPTAILA